MDLCTLFDSNYLDRGIALCESLNEVSDNFNLYIFAFDELAVQVLNELKLKNVTVIPEQNIMDDELARIKKERSRAEYCWTCTPVIIEYVLDHYDVRACTYIDADMFFYESPEFLWKELEGKTCNASIIEHRFPDNITKATNQRLHGRYCVEFNTFFGTKEGRAILRWWKQKCMESCSMKLNDKSFGDQKYLDDWKVRFRGIHEVQNIGAGVAPWNISDYTFVSKRGKHISLLYRREKTCRLIFYHFQNLKFLEDHKADIGVYNEPGKIDKRLVDELYGNYVKRIIKIRKMLEERFFVKFQGYEDRSKGSCWKYTGMIDLMAYIAVYMNRLFRGKKNLIVYSENGFR